MDELERKARKLFKDIMSHCRAERKAMTDTTVRELANELGKTANFVSSIENGREFPSLKTFLKYLIVNGFDTTQLQRLAIDKASSNTRERRAKAQLIKKIYDLNQDQVSFLVEQAKVAEGYALRSKQKR